jgi:hypothetical protein
MPVVGKSKVTANDVFGQDSGLSSAKDGDFLVTDKTKTGGMVTSSQLPLYNTVFCPHTAMVASVPLPSSLSGLQMTCDPTGQNPPNVHFSLQLPYDYLPHTDLQVSFLVMSGPTDPTGDVKLSVMHQIVQFNLNGAFLAYPNKDYTFTSPFPTRSYTTTLKFDDITDDTSNSEKGAVVAFRITRQLSGTALDAFPIAVRGLSLRYRVGGAGLVVHP